MALPRPSRFARAVALTAFAAGCNAADAPRPTADGPASVAVSVGDATLHLELAADPETRQRGMAGRDHVPEGSGMLFAFPGERPLAFVMRDCLIPLDLAFLDADGGVVRMHTMAVEPRRPDESDIGYEIRLHRYTSGGPAQFAIETAAGRLGALGLRIGDRVQFDREAVLRATR